MDKRYKASTNYIKGLNDVADFHFKTYNINPNFSEDLEKLSARDFVLEECRDRKDFRRERAFTIDCEDCKDMDDAVSILKTKNGYRLAVHIADVSEYVPLGSELDKAASNRATSIYLPHRTIPMLIPVLSNNLCSLNPGEVRNTLSVIIHLDECGNIMRSEITKGKILSRVKGIYTEVNRLLSGDRDTKLLEKYGEVYDEIFAMAKLSGILRGERKERGATVRNSNRPKISVYKHSIRLTPMKKSTAENMIEEFMILANRVVAEYLYENDLPAIFRIQEEKNHLAAYQTLKLRHSELALESYSHFTSPIRRIADLKNHQILTMHLNGYSTQHIRNLFEEHLGEICETATKRSRTVKQIEDKCIQYCYKEYFRNYGNQRYIGTVLRYDRKNRPVIRLNRYNINLIGKENLRVNLGEKYSFFIDVSDEGNGLFASKLLRVVA